MTYRVVRFFKNGCRQLVKTGLTREQAQAHCQHPATAEKGKWFDGFEKEGDDGQN